MKTNGEATDATVEVRKILTDSEKLDILIEAVADIRATIEELKDGHDELVEKISNMELPWGDGFNSRDRYDS